MRRSARAPCELVRVEHDRPAAAQLDRSPGLLLAQHLVLLAQPENFLAERFLRRPPLLHLLPQLLQGGNQLRLPLVLLALDPLGQLGVRLLDALEPGVEDDLKRVLMATS